MPALWLTSHVILGTLHDLSLPQFADMENGDKGIYLMEGGEDPVSACLSSSHIRAWHMHMGSAESTWAVPVSTSPAGSSNHSRPHGPGVGHTRLTAPQNSCCLLSHSSSSHKLSPSPHIHVFLKVRDSNLTPMRR